MKIVIVEDEIKTANALAKVISLIVPEAEIVATLQSVTAARAWFKKYSIPDLTFMDVQLSDGLCFDIFEKVEITCPVVFCTAYDEYAIEGFKANGIDYILKPFSEETIKRTFQKIKNLENHFQQKTFSSSNGIQHAIPTGGKTSFLVFKNNRYTVIPIQKIAYFFIKNELPALFTFTGETFFINQSLDTIASQLPSGSFYRITRQYLVNFEAIGEIEQWFSRKLYIHLKVPVADKIIINKNNTTPFLQWMDGNH